MHAPHKIQVFADHQLEYFRNAILGVHRYANETSRLSLDYSWLPHEQEGNLRALVRRDSVRGVIAITHDERTESRLLKLPVPVINLSNAIPHPRLNVVTQDDFQAGVMAATHLLECGCRSLAFWGVWNKRYSDRRLAGFRSAAGKITILTDYERNNERNLRATHATIRAFASRLPPHCGVFVVLDLFARMFLRAARELGRAVPDDLAILGAGDDPFLTALEPVPLSSLRFPSGDIGYRAAALMDELLSRPARAPKRRELLLPCCELIPRQSTDAIVFADQAVSKAKHFIRDHPGCNVAEVLQAVGVSRSGLQERFRRSVGRTILEDIHHNRLNRAIALLQTTDHSMETIAEMVGFGSAQRLFSLFRAKIGSTPGEVRSAARAMKS